MLAGRQFITNMKTSILSNLIDLLIGEVAMGDNIGSFSGD